ncbi:class II aldolase/adducin family protein [Amycolatopsis sp. cmx-4-83]|uniref:class II aldolase/adducin family protein n=1 Tax=Amycolatopsis sp. cmx-4-83 TaxID=2790940 RepID=UPI00397ADC5B
MGHEAERHHIIRSVSDMTRWGTLDPAGGSVSVRAGSGNIVSTTASSAFVRWDITARNLMVYSPEGSIVERATDLAPPDAPLHMAIYREFPNCNAIVHSHAPYSLAFASLGLGVPSCTNKLDTMGEVPCFTSDDPAVKEDVLTGRVDIEVAECMGSRPDVIAGYLLTVNPQMLEHFGPRAGELDRHGLGFVVYRHGVFVFARHLDEAVENLTRIEVSARTALFQATLHGGISGIKPDALHNPGGTWSDSVYSGNSR